MKHILVLLFVFIFQVIPITAQECTSTLRYDGIKLKLSQQEWKERLSPEQFWILRQGGTEPPYDNKYNYHKEEGIYECAACKLALFSSQAKYDSGTGWPSFWKPICPQNVTLRDDYKLGFLFKRIELLCSRCDSHLGHLFDDGPPPTGKRYCINSLTLEFISRKN